MVSHIMCIKCTASHPISQQQDLALSISEAMALVSGIKLAKFDKEEQHASKLAGCLPAVYNVEGWLEFILGI
jgi:hypothetical protein